MNIIKKYPYYNVDNPENLKELMSLSIEKYGDNIAYWFTKLEKTEKTFKNCLEDVNALGTYLFSQGLMNTKIALLGENSYEWIVSYFAIVNGGNVVIPLDREMSEEELSDIIKKSEAQCLLYSDKYKNVAKQTKEQLGEILKFAPLCDFEQFIDEGKQIIDKGNTAFNNYKIHKDDLACICYTSGTSGKSKGVLLSHYNIVMDAVHTSNIISLPTATITLLPLYHTFGFISNVTIPMLRGYSVFISSDLKRMMPEINIAKPKYICVVPAFIENFFKIICNYFETKGILADVIGRFEKSDNLTLEGIEERRLEFKEIWDLFGGDLRLLVVGGAPLDEKYIRYFNVLGLDVKNGYGITECSPVVSVVRNKNYSTDSVGTIVPGVEVKIVNFDDSNVGEICVKGDTISQGYYNDAENNQKSFENGWFKTGDVGYLDENYQLHINGRIKNMIILSNGKNVASEELEQLIKQIEYVDEVIVYGDKIDIVAEVYIKDINEEIKEQLNSDINNLNKSLAIYKKISKVIYRETPFVKTSTQKIKRGI